MDKNKKLNKMRLRRRNHVRNKLRGNADRPRLCINRTLNNFSCQLVDDETGRTLVSASTRDKDIRSSVGHGGNISAAAVVGKAVGEKAIAAGVKAARFDRGHTKYHGRVKAFADAARETGLSF